VNIERVVLTADDVPARFEPIRDISGAVAADQLYPGAAHGVRAVFISDPWVLTCLVTHFADPGGAQESVEAYGRVFTATAHDPQPIPFLDALGEGAAGGVASGDEDAPGAVAMMAWSDGPVRCDLSLSCLTDDVTTADFFSHEPATHLEEQARLMAGRARALAG
jgi:hypothetical protein